MLLALRGAPISRKIALRNTWMAPDDKNAVFE